MVDADISSDKSRATLPIDYSSFISKIDSRLWVRHSQLKAANALVQTRSQYDESNSLVAISFMLGEMADNTDQVIDLLDDGGLTYDTDKVKRRLREPVQ